MKKIISIFTAVFMCIGCLGFIPESFPEISVHASAAYSGTCGENVTWTLDGDTLTISGSGEMKNYSLYSDTPWHDYIYSIKSVIIENGVTSIGMYAFYKCTSLTSVVIPNSVRSIGFEAFYECTSLTSVTIPDSVMSIESSAFAECKILTSV